MVNTGTRHTSLALWLLVVALGATSIARASDQGSAAPGPPTWREVLQLVRNHYPDVPQMTTQELASRLSGGNADDILLLDARSRSEFNVSHLKNAMRASNAFLALKAIETHPAKSTVVVYCSVGYRSARLVKQLRERGITDVHNLEGSLFQWANEGRPLHRYGERVHAAHPYDEEWGQLLNQRHWPN